MTTPVPSMSTRGFITEISERVDQMMVHFVYTDALQSTHFSGRLFSLPAILERHVGSILSAAAAVQTELTTYFRKYFVQADVIVQAEEEDPDNSSSRAVLRITARVTENGQEYEVSKLLSIVDGRFKEFINLNNNEAST